MRVLVIEDDDAIRSVVERGLRAEGFDVDACADGAAGLWKLLEGGYAAVVLDLLLPGMNGYTVCARARAEGVTTPILVLTAKSGEYDQIDGRQLGTTATKALAHETLQTVSVDRMAYFLARYGEAKTRYGQGIGPVKYREKPVC